MKVLKVSLYIIFTGWMSMSLTSCETINDLFGKDEDETVIPEGWNRYEYSMNDGLNSLSNTRHLAFDNTGTPYFFVSGQVYKKVGDKFELFTSTTGEMVDADFRDAVFDASNNIWVAVTFPFSTEKSGIFKFDGSSWSVINKGISMHTICYTTTGELFAGGESGLYKYDGVDFKHVDGWDISLYSLEEGFNGELWMLPSNGGETEVVKYHNSTFTTYERGREFTTKYNNEYTSIVKGSDGNMYFTPQRPSSPRVNFLKYDGTNFTEHTESCTDCGWGDRIVQGVVEKDSRLWFMTNQSYLVKYDNGTWGDNYNGFESPLDDGIEDQKYFYDMDLSNGTIWIISGQKNNIGYVYSYSKP